MLYLPYHHRTTLIAHARAEAPKEACGILAGRDGRVRRVYRLRNVALQPETRYQADPEGQLRAFLDMERRGLEMLAIYHSHPTSPAYPSATDLALAYYPDTCYLIISLMRKPPEIRCFSLSDGQIKEEAVIVGI